MPDILFHQYDSSPFSEKVRVCFGIKQLAWGYYNTVKVFIQQITKHTIGLTLLT